MKLQNILLINLVFAAVILAAAAVLLLVRKANQTGVPLCAELIYGDSNTRLTFPLEKDADYDVDTGYLTVHIKIQDGAARFVDSPCPDHICESFGWLSEEDQTAAYSVEIWKRFRKWGGIPTGITQNVKDLLASREIENIFENSDFVYLLNQASGDRQILSKALNISPSQQNYITNSNAGEGLIFYGSTIVPFKDDFPKDTMLYRYMTTKPEETLQN